MKCTRVEKFLPLQVAGDLRGRRARAVESHLAACEQCRRAAEEYRASRELLPGAAALPADFDDAFYEEIRNSVLARIRHDRTTAPPARYRLASLFDARPAYAASLALLFIAAALALYSYAPRTPEGGEGRREIAAAGGERPATPAAVKTPLPTGTPQATRPGGDERASLLRPANEFERGAAGAGRRAAKSPPKSAANVVNARNGSTPGLHATSRTPSITLLNPPAPPPAAATAPQANAAELATVAGAQAGGGATAAAPQVSRIEIQTSDPNIRIIWLSPGAEEPARPLK